MIKLIKNFLKKENQKARPFEGKKSVKLQQSRIRLWYIHKRIYAQSTYWLDELLMLMEEKNRYFPYKKRVSAPVEAPPHKLYKHFAGKIEECLIFMHENLGNDGCFSCYLLLYNFANKIYEKKTFFSCPRLKNWKVKFKKLTTAGSARHTSMN